MQYFPSSVSLILLLYPYLSHFFPLSIGSFPLFHQGHEYISSYQPPPSPGKSLFLLSVCLSLIIPRDNCMQALSSFSSLKRRLPSRQRSMVSVSVLYDVTTPPIQYPHFQNTHTHNTSTQVTQ